MDVARRVLVQRHGLEQDELAVRLRLRNIYQFEKGLSFLEDIGVALLADLAFKFFPVVRSDVFTVLLHVPLRLEPVLETCVVDVADCAGAFTCQNKRIVLAFLSAPAESTLDRFLTSFPAQKDRVVSNLSLSNLTSWSAQ